MMAKAPRKRPEMAETMVVRREPIRLKMAKIPTRISTAVEITAMM